MQRLYCLIAILAFVSLAQTASLPSYGVEVYFVVEPSSLQKYYDELTSGTVDERAAKAVANAKADIDYFVVEMNEIFHTLTEYGLNIEIRSRKLQFLDQNILGRGSVDVEPGLEKFDTWLGRQGAFADLGQDLAVLWTAAELTSYSTGDGPTGYAHVDGVCSSTRSSAIVEFDGTYHTAVVTAHEIAHILGANHDTGSSGYVMSPTISPASQRRWSFSSKTANAIKSAISQTSCLQRDNPASVSLSGPPTKELLDPDVICARKLKSKDTFMCKDPYFYGNRIPKGDAICGEIYCKDPARPDYCLTVYPTDGMPCGANKICNDGRCVYDSSGNTADVDDDCIFDDQRLIRLDMGRRDFEGSCPSFLQQYGDNYCSQDSVNEKCCGSCKRLNDKTGTDSGSRSSDTGSTGTDTGRTDTDTGSTGTDNRRTGTDTGSTHTDTRRTGSDTGFFGTSDVRPACTRDEIYDCRFYRSYVCNPANGFVEKCCKTCGNSYYNSHSSPFRLLGKRSVDSNAHIIANRRGRPVNLGPMIQVKELTNKKEEVVYQPIDDE